MCRSLVCMHRPAVEQHTDIRQLVQRADARAKLREVAFRLKQQLTHGQVTTCGTQQGQKEECAELNCAAHST